MRKLYFQLEMFKNKMNMFKSNGKLVTKHWRGVLMVLMVSTDLINIIIVLVNVMRCDIKI